MDTVTPNTPQISLFGDDELPIIEDPRAKDVTPSQPEQPRTLTVKPAPTAQQIAEREAIERAAEARRKKYLAQKDWEASRRPVARRVRNRWENAYD